MMIVNGPFADPALAPETVRAQGLIRTAQQNALGTTVFTTLAGTLAGVGIAAGTAVGPASLVRVGAGTVLGALGGYFMGRAMKHQVAAINAYDMSRGS